MEIVLYSDSKRYLLFAFIRLDSFFIKIHFIVLFWFALIAVCT